MKKLTKLLAIVSWVCAIYLLIMFFNLKKTLNFEQQALVTPIITYVKSTSLDDEEKAFIKKINPFGILLNSENIESKAQIKTLIRELKLLFPGRKLYVAIDQEGGQVDRLKKIFAKDKLLKEASYYGAIAEYDLVQAKRELYRDSKFTAEILADLGFDINLAPMVDLTFFKNSSVKGVKKSWAATEARSYSSEVRIVVELATVFIKAMHEVGIITVVKHIPGLGRAFEDSHNGEAIIEAGYLDLLEKDFLVFKALAKIAKMAMVSHGTYSAIDPLPATFSKKIIKDVIKREIQFNGLLISDALNMQAISNYKLEDRVKKSLAAGVDIVIPNYVSRIVAIKAVKAIKEENLKKFNQKLVALGYLN